MGFQASQRSYQLPSEQSKRITAFSADTGKRLWEERMKRPYRSRPLLNGRTLYTHPVARDLLTGKLTGFTLKGRSSGACGNISGGRNILLYRSGTLGYTDLLRGTPTQSYGPMRPGCWINAIPAGGMVLMPDASAQCRCSYLMKVSVALTYRNPLR